MIASRHRSLPGAMGVTICKPMRNPRLARGDDGGASGRFRAQAMTYTGDQIEMGKIGFGYGSEWHLLWHLARHRASLDDTVRTVTE